MGTGSRHVKSSDYLSDHTMPNNFQPIGKNMNTFLNHLTAALTVALLFTSTASYSGNSHQAIADAYDKAYGDASGKGMIVRTANDVTTIRLIGISDSPMKICDIFGEMSSHIIVIDSSLNEMHYDCSL